MNKTNSRIKEGFMGFLFGLWCEDIRKISTLKT
jgi:hypothetical protein